MSLSSRSLAAVAALVVVAVGASGTAAGQGGDPTVAVTPSTALEGGQMVTVTGDGYTPGGGIYVQFCAEPTGAIGTADGRAKACNPDQGNDHTVWKTPIDATGTFSVQLKVESAFGEVDCASAQCGVFTRKDHMGGASDYTQDAFAPAAFASASAPVATDPAAAPAATEQPATTANAPTGLANTGANESQLLLAAAALLLLGGLVLGARRRYANSASPMG